MEPGTTPAEPKQSGATWPVARAADLTIEHIPDKLRQEIVASFAKQNAKLTVNLAQVMQELQRVKRKLGILTEDIDHDLERLNGLLQMSPDAMMQRVGVTPEQVNALVPLSASQ
jgi:hypothetical protein